MKKLFIPYEQALELKELGYDEPCFGKYIDEGFDSLNTGWIKQIKLVPQTQYSNQKPITFCQEDNPYETNKNGKILAPLYQQAFKWFRAKHYLKFHIKEDRWNHWCTIEIIMISEEEDSDIECYESYEEAELACLIKLIEIIKNK